MHYQLHFLLSVNVVLTSGKITKSVRQLDFSAIYIEVRAMNDLPSKLDFKNLLDSYTPKTYKHFDTPLSKKNYF